LSEKLTKLVVSTILNHGVKGSDVRDWHFKVREVDGVYLVDLSTTVAISPKTELTKQERAGKHLMMSFVAAFVMAVVLATVGMLLPDAVLGRELVLISTIPGFVAQLIGARFLIKARYRKDGIQQLPADAGTVKTEEIAVQTPQSARLFREN
jgi:hypothetical protein